MKTTYLVFDKETGNLRVAGRSEWNRIMEENRRLPRDKRRFFIEDRIDAGKELDCMYIETTREDYDLWHAENQRNYRRRQAEKDVKFVSLEYDAQGDEQGSLSGKLSDGIDWEMVAIEKMDMEALIRALKEWRSWGVDILNYYLAGQKRSCTRQISQRYGVSEQTVRTWKREFETFVVGCLHVQ
ncbi:hypothetical protein B5F98_00260 [Pseudoflavonifractor sp. An44]|uniref:helix-turn-helix domain-containing protein n=1 Tax=Pseudoflavonifractor sp. An44 TaxID=1965635 RepID=UPI000B37A88A|nr:helix-turn-helix domain-containing protein [Pseudoflavonifractor sp. An44]OUN99650.1 hypothetical protein B5F98_00260 [Pseudoflavonifractor sp. An44]